MLDAVRAVRDLGLHCGLATNQQNLRGTYMRNSLGFETIFDEQFYSSNLGLRSLRQGTFKDHGPHLRCVEPGAVHRHLRAG